MQVFALDCPIKVVIFDHKQSPSERNAQGSFSAVSAPSITSYYIIKVNVRVLGRTAFEYMQWQINGLCIKFNLLYFYLYFKLTTTALLTHNRH